MAETFYPFVENGSVPGGEGVPLPSTPARIAVYDDMAMTPRVVTVEPSGIRTYLDEITETVYKLASERCAEWSFMLIRELVENLIHASFIEPTIAILDNGKTIVFSDQGPGIPNKAAALKPSSSSATSDMKRYIRGVGSGLPIVEHQLELQHGSITIEDNLGRGTIVTVSLAHRDDDPDGQQGWDQGQGGVFPTYYPGYYPGYAQQAVQAGYPARQAYGQPYVQYAPVAPQYGQPYDMPNPYGQPPFGQPHQAPYGQVQGRQIMDDPRTPYGGMAVYQGQQAFGGPYGTAQAGMQQGTQPVGLDAYAGAGQGQDTYGVQPAGMDPYGNRRAGQALRPAEPAARGGSPDAGPSRAARSVIAAMASQQSSGTAAFPTAEPFGARAAEAPQTQAQTEMQVNASESISSLIEAQPDAAARAAAFARGEVPAQTPSARVSQQPSSMDAHVPLTKDQRDIIMLFAGCEKIGPKELTTNLGVAPATGSRRLKEIATTGLVVKKGQKYVLTGEGQRVFTILASEGE